MTLSYETVRRSRKVSRSGKTVTDLGPVVWRFAEPDGLDRMLAALHSAWCEPVIR